MTEQMATPEGAGLRFRGIAVHRIVSEYVEAGRVYVWRSEVHPPEVLFPSPPGYSVFCASALTDDEVIAACSLYEKENDAKIFAELDDLFARVLRHTDTATASPSGKPSLSLPPIRGETPPCPGGPWTKAVDLCQWCGLGREQHGQAAAR